MNKVAWVFQEKILEVMVSEPIYLLWMPRMGPHLETGLMPRIGLGLKDNSTKISCRMDGGCQI